MKRPSDMISRVQAPTDVPPSPSLWPVRPSEAQHQQWSKHTIIRTRPDASLPPPSSSSTIPSERPSRRSSADSYTGTTDNTHLPTPPLHSDASSPAFTMSPSTPPDVSHHNAKIMSSTGSNTMQISGDMLSPPYLHVHSRRSSSPITAYPKSQPIETRRTSPKKSSHAYQHAAPVKSSTINAFARPCV